MAMMVDAEPFPLPSGRGVVLGFDDDGALVGLVAYGHGSAIEVPLDRAQFQALADSINQELRKARL